MSVKSELLALTQRAAGAFDMPAVRRLYLPEPRPHENRHTEFGVVELEDGAAGLYYAWLGDSQRGMNRRFKASSFAGASPVEIIPLLNSGDDADRSLGMAAINAVTASLFRRTGFSPETAEDSLGSLTVDDNDHIGMVGYFPSLVARLRGQGLRVTVVERKSRFADQEDEHITVTAEATELRRCSKILVTASTLLNDSLEEVLDCCTQAEAVVIVGPTAGFPPDPLFQRNVTAVGGTMVLNAEATIRDLEADAGISNSTRKYLITKDDYPDIGVLLARLKD